MQILSQRSPARLIAGAAVILVLMVVSSCQPAQPPRSSTVIQRDYPTPARPLNLPGQVVFAPGDGSLWLQSANGGNVHVLIKSTGKSYAESPAFSPDGKQVVYAAKSYDQNGEMTEVIRVVNVDGTNDRIIAAPPDAKTAFSFPAWNPDGKEIWFTRSSVSSEAQSEEVDRVSLSGGTPQRVFEGGRAAAVSPDGEKITFLRFDYGTLRSSLWIAQTDGSNPKQLLDQDVFASLEGARFSLDSQSIVFAASGVPQKQLPAGQANRNGTEEFAWFQTASADSCLARALFTCWLDTASAHGMPWDLWLVNVDGTRFEQLTQVGADSPFPAWSPDGKFVAFMDFSGMYVVNRETKEGYLISMNGGHGALDWH